MDRKPQDQAGALPANTDLDIQILYGAAVQFHEAGQLTEAERLYRRILAMDPRHAGALHLLGVIAHQTGQSDLAADLIGRAIGIKDTVAAYHSNLGNALRSLGRPAQALESYDAALRIQPDYADAHHNRGNTLADLGRFDDAVTSYDAALRLQPDYAKAHANRGNALRSLGRLDDALASYDAALRINPEYAVAFSGRGDVLRSLGRLDDAVASYDAALRIRPDYADAHHARGNALWEHGRFDDALAAYDAALHVRPDHAGTHSSPGNALRDLGRFEEAVASYDAALRLQPDHAGAHNNRATALVNLARLDEALESYDAAVRLRPDYVEALSNRGNALVDLGRLDEALASYEAALRVKPDHADAHNNLIYCLHYGSDASGQVIRAAAQRFAAFFETAPASFANTPDPERRLRVGLVSGDFRRHPVGFFLFPFLVNHARAEVAIFCYSTRPSDDDLTGKLRAAADHWRSLVGMTDKAAADQVKADAIDILVDLSGHTAFNRLPLFALRPAPVQATWLGYWGTTGLAAMDYILSDAVTIPPGEEDFYSERVLRLASGRFCYAPPAYAPKPAPPPCLSAGTITFGSFNNLRKIGPGVVALWAAVLCAVPGARLLLKWQSLADEGVRRSMIEAFAAHDIAANRLILRAASPHPRMLAEYGDMDIALDPFPFSGGLTSCEALLMGVPVVTLPGAVGPSRQTLGFLKALGLESLAAADPDDYVRIAAGLAADPARLTELRQSLRKRMAASPLCDGPGFARNVETAFRTMWREWCGQQTR